MASIRKRSQWRVVTENDTANAAVFDTYKQAAASARALMARGVVLGYVNQTKKRVPDHGELTASVDDDLNRLQQ